MSETYIPVALRRLVEERAQAKCEYCHLLAALAFLSHEIDHIIAEKHGGSTESENLAYTCWRCNRHKGSDLGSFDPQTNEFSFLFHPRRDEWVQNFELQGLTIVGLTSVGRTTVQLLQLNTPDRLRERGRYIQGTI
jgi:HNH endonuclease